MRNAFHLREACLVILQTSRRKIHGKQVVGFGRLLLSLLTKMHEKCIEKRHPNNEKLVVEFGRLLLSLLTKVHEKCIEKRHPSHGTQVVEFRIRKNPRDNDANQVVQIWLPA